MEMEQPAVVDVASPVVMVDDGSDSDIDAQTFTSDELRERRLVEAQRNGEVLDIESPAPAADAEELGVPADGGSTEAARRRQ